jgi:uncharacterized membrane protein
VWLILAPKSPIEAIQTKGAQAMHNNFKPLHLIVGLVACAITLDILASALPRVLPYLVVLAVIFIIVRLVLFHTRH